MNLQEIKKAVLNGQVVNWSNGSYRVVFDSLGQWLIECTLNGHCIGLTHMNGITMNGDENEFYTTKKEVIQ